MKKITLNFFLALICCWTIQIHAQPREKYVKVIVSPDHSDWLYKTDEKVNFRVKILKDGNPVTGIMVHYEIKPEMMETIKSGDVTYKKDPIIINGGTMKNPGFLRCWATIEYEGKEYKGYATAGFEPEKIKPTTTEPSDFTEFWTSAKKDLSEIPLDAIATLLPERCTETVNVYHISIQNYPGKARVYGILCKPKAPGTYPALLHVPGAGIRPYYGDIGNAEKGIITLQIGIHGVPVTMERYVYDNLSEGGLRGYPTSDMDDVDAYYYKRVYLGCVRAIDYIFSIPEFDGETLAVSGGSQGGALSIITTGLDDRVKWLVPFFPALSDLTGYLEGRAGGWPHMFRHVDPKDPVTKREIEVSKYYDVVNFARHVNVEGWYSWGFNDNVCPPTSMYSAYNVINAPKQLFLVPETGHWTYPEQQEKKNEWLLKKLIGDK
ncbi:acetylxylan esterase [Bacteroidota bacterium]